MQRAARSLVAGFGTVGTQPESADQLRLQQTLLVVSSSMMGTLGVIWGLMYWAFDEALAGAIPAGYALLSFASIALFLLTKRYQLFRFSQLLLSLLLPVLLGLALGGFVNSSAVVLWSLSSPIGALLFAGRRRAVGWFSVYLTLVMLSGFLEAVGRPVNNLPPTVITVFFVMNIAGVSAVTFVLLQYFVRQKNLAYRLLHAEREKSERLLLNVLPRKIAEELKERDGLIAERFDSASILFADIVGFTPLSAQMAADETVSLLNEIFTYFDSLVSRYNLEKIRTIGDNYMVASGVPSPRPDHAHALAYVALDMMEYARQNPVHKGHAINFRIGINSGSVIGGVIGRHKFQYDVWGDAVNVASRMESQGRPGKIQITGATYDLIKDDFQCVARGQLEVKGKGSMDTWFLEAAR